MFPMTLQRVVAWLIDDAGGRLGPASKECLEAASVHDDQIAGVLVESIE